MADRNRDLRVRIIGDAKSLERELLRATRLTRRFEGQFGSSTIPAELTKQAERVRQLAGEEEKLFKIRSRRASSIGAFKIAGVGLGAGLGLFAATQAVRELGASLETTGKKAFTTEGRLKNVAAALTSGNIVGAIQAWRAAPKTLEDLGFAAALGSDQIRALQQVADGATASFEKFGAAIIIGAGGAETGTRAYERLKKITDEAGTSSQKLAQEYLAQRDAIALTQLATDTLADSVARLGQQFLTQSGAVVTFKGAVDDLVRAGRGEPVFGNIPSTTFGVRPGRPTIPPLSPSQRRELNLIGREGTDRVPLLQDRVRQLNNQLKRGNINQEQRLKILTNLRQTEAEIAAIYKDQATARRAAAEAAAQEAASARARAAADAQAARARAAQAAEDRRNALISSQFRRLGLDANGDPVTPGVPNLKRRVGQLTARLTAEGVLTPKVKAQLKRISAVLSDALVPKDVRAKIKDLLDDIAQQFQTRTRAPKFRGINTDQFLEGLNLSPQDRRRLQARLAQVGRNGTVPNTGPSAFGFGLAGRPLSVGRRIDGGIVITGPVTVVANNPDAFERALQQKARRRATQTTGPFAGNGMGFVR